MGSAVPGRSVGGVGGCELELLLCRHLPGLRDQDLDDPVFRYPVLADPAHELAAAYGVLLEDGSAQRGTFVLDPQGVVRYASVTDLNVGRSAGEVLRVVYALQTGGLCPAGWRPGQPTLQAA